MPHAFAAARGRSFLFALVALTALPAQAQWAFGFGGPDRDQAEAVALDADGGVFLTGTFQGSPDFDPGPGTQTLTSVGGQDIFLAHYLADGALDWAVRLGGANWERATGLAVDAAGNVYVVGSFEGTADFDPGTGTYTLTGAGFEEAFVASYTPAGALRWAFAFGGGDYDQAVAVTATANGIYVTGAFEGTADFDPGAGTYPLTGSEFGDVFVAHYGFDGTFGWAFDVGIFAHDDGAAIAADAAGNVFVTGSFSGTPVDFDPGPGAAFPAYAGTNDYFVASYTAGGAFRWVASAGSIDADAGEAVAVDADGNVYTAGFFNGSADFDPGTGTTLLSTNGAQDIFVASYTNDGAFRWAFPIGGTAWDNGHGLAVVGSDLFLTGSFSETADFDPGAGVFNLTAQALDDIYLAHYTTEGAFVDAFHMGGGYGNFGLSLAATDEGEVWVAGAFEGSADFDPGAGSIVLTAQDRDGFLARYPLGLTGGCDQSLTATVDDTTPVPGQTLTVTVTVRNEGPDVAPLDLWYEHYRLGAGPGRTQFLASGTLPPGATVTRDVRVRVPDGAPAGTYAATLRIGDFATGDVCDTVGFTLTVVGAPRVGSAGTTFTAEVEGNFFAAEASAPTAAASPNPFARQTVIRYEVAEAADVRLAVFDVLGREIAVLVDGRVEAGTHAAPFDARGLTAGTYVYRLQIGGDVQTGRMTLAR